MLRTFLLNSVHEYQSLRNRTRGIFVNWLLNKKKISYRVGDMGFFSSTYFDTTFPFS